MSSRHSIFLFWLIVELVAIFVLGSYLITHDDVSWGVWLVWWLGLIFTLYDITIWRKLPRDTRVEPELPFRALSHAEESYHIATKCWDERATEGWVCTREKGHDGPCAGRMISYAEGISAEEMREATHWEERTRADSSPARPYDRELEQPEPRKRTPLPWPQEFPFDDPR